MLGKDLTINTEDRHPLAILHLGGFLAQLEVYRLKKEVDTLLGEGRRGFVLDLSALTFIDSTGIGALAQLRQECQKVGGFLAIVVPQAAHVRQTLEYSALNRLIEFMPDVPAALAWLREKYGLTAGEKNESAAIYEQLNQILGRLDQFEHRLRQLESVNH